MLRRIGGVNVARAARAKKSAARRLLEGRTQVFGVFGVWRVWTQCVYSGEPETYLVGALVRKGELTRTAHTLTGL